MVLFSCNLISNMGSREKTMQAGFLNFRGRHILLLYEVWKTDSNLVVIAITESKCKLFYFYGFCLMLSVLLRGYGILPYVGFKRLLTLSPMIYSGLQWYKPLSPVWWLHLSSVLASAALLFSELYFVHANSRSLFTNDSEVCIYHRWNTGFFFMFVCLFKL